MVKKKKKVKKTVVKKKVKAVTKRCKAALRKKPAKTIAKTARMPFKKPPAGTIEGTFIGTVTHYFPHVKAGAILVENGELALGDMIRIKGHTSNFKQKITSMEIDRKPIEKASKGDEIGLLVKSRVRIRDKAYKI